MAASSAHLTSLFPSPTHPAIPTAIHILTALRSSSSSSTLGLSNAEIVALPGISAILACERLNQTDSISLQTIQRLSSTTPKLFTSGLAKCRAFLASSERKTPTKRKYPTDGVPNTPPSGMGIYGGGESSKVGVGKTPPSGKRGLDLSGLKRSSHLLPVSVSTSSTDEQVAGPSSFSVPHVTNATTSTSRAELEERDELNKTPTKNRTVDFIPELPSIRGHQSINNQIPHSPTSQSFPFASSSETIESQSQPSIKRSRTRLLIPKTSDLSISPYIPIPHPRIALIDVIGGGIYEPPEHVEDGVVFRKMCPPPPPPLPLEEDIMERDDCDEDEDVKHEHRANQRRYERMNGVRRSRTRVNEIDEVGRMNNDQGGEIAWDTMFSVGFGMGGRRVEGEREMWEGLNEEIDVGRMTDKFVGWEERVDRYLDIFPSILDLSSTAGPTTATATGNTITDADANADLANTISSTPPSRRRRLLPSMKKQLSALQATRAAQEAEEKAEIDAKAMEERRWLGRAEMRGIAVKVWVDGMKV